MTLSVITGIPRKSLSEDVVSRVTAAVGRGEEVVWLTPNYHTAKRVSRELRERDSISYGVAATTMGAYFETLWGLYGNGQKLVDTVTREVFIAQVFKEHVWRHLAHPPVSTNGLKEALHVLSPFISDPHRLAARTETEREVRDLIIEYFDILEETEFIEKQQALDALDLPAQHAPFVVIDGFTSLSSFDVSMIDRLARHSEVSCLFEWGSDYPQTEVSTQSIQKLESMGAVRQDKGIEPPQGEIEEAARALWRDVNDVNATGALRLAEAAGEGLESILVLDQVKELLGGRAGYAPRDIAIVHPRLELVYRKFVEVAEQREIPLEVDIALSFKDTSFGKAFMALVNTVGDSGDRTTALTFLRSPYSGVSPDEAYKMDEYWRQNRVDDPKKILSSLLRVSGDLPFLVKEVQSAQRSAVDSQWAKRWEHVGSRFLANAKEHRAAYRTGRESGGVGGDLVGDLGDGDVRAIDPFDAAAHTALIDALEAAAAIGDALSSDLFFDALKRARVTTGDKEGTQAVLLTEPERIVGREFPAVIIAGLSAQEFPAGGDETFTSALMSSYSLADKEQRGVTQRNLFYSLVASAQERLILSRTSMGLDGTELSPSPFYEDIKTLYQKSCEYDSDEARLKLPPLTTLGFSQLELVAGRYSDELVRLRKAVLEGKRRIAKRSRGEDGVPGLGDEYGVGDRPFSASALEAYLACPYRWFYSRILRANEIDSQFDNAERGSIAHEILERFYERVIAEIPEGRVTPENLPRAHDLLDEVFDQAQQERTSNRESQEEHVQRSPEEWMGFESLLRQLHQLIEADSLVPDSLKPTKVEWDFGDEENGKLEIEGIPIRGTVDRIDVGEQGAVLFDYKSGKGYSATAMKNERRVQAVLYARAVEKEFGLPVVASLYRSIRSGEANGLELKEAFPENMKIAKTPNKLEEWEDTFDEIMGMAHRAVEGIKAATIKPDPNVKDATACAYCDAHLICEKARV